MEWRSLGLATIVATCSSVALSAQWLTSSTPRVGEPVHFRLEAPPAGLHALLCAGPPISATAWPGINGNFRLNPSNAGLILGGTTPPSGVASWSFPVPGVPDLTGTRSIEEIRRVFDANKGAIFSIYNRALRKDPTLLGKVVLELVIEPDGTVSACEVLTSELGSEELITRVVRRVQLFDFGAKDVGVTRISYPVHFLPT